jgi:hypothetical protein
VPIPRDPDGARIFPDVVEILLVLTMLFAVNCQGVVTAPELARVNAVTLLFTQKFMGMAPAV